MKGFRLVALTPKGEDAVQKFNVKSRKAVVEEVSKNPYTVSFVFKRRFALFLNELAIKTFANQTLLAEDCIEGVDYDLEMIH